MSALIHQQVQRVFLYGHTLFYEPEFDAERGYKEILDFAVKNNNNLSAEDLAEKSLEIRKEICKYICERTGYDYEILGPFGLRAQSSLWIVDKTK